jgi:U3 small nucleolar RNA-associated protein 13
MEDDTEPKKQRTKADGPERTMHSASLKGNAGGLSRAWRVLKEQSELYDGGKVQLSKNEEFIACMCRGDVCFWSMATGEVIKFLQEDLEDEDEKEAIITFALHPDNKQIVTASQNLLLRTWDIETGKCTKSLKAHERPVMSMDFDSTGVLVATGSSDRTVKVWDIEKGHCTHNFKGHEMVVNTVKFHPDINRLQLVSCSDDNSVMVWDLATMTCAAHLTDHMSTVTSVIFSTDGWTLITAGRDKVVNIWDLRDYSLLKTVVVYESIEAALTLSSAVVPGVEVDSPTDVVFATGGNKANVRVWHFHKVLSEFKQNPHGKKAKAPLRHTCR